MGNMGITDTVVCRCKKMPKYKGRKGRIMTDELGGGYFVVKFEESIIAIHKNKLIKR